MTLDPAELDKLHDLASATCDGSITPEQFAQLTELLRDNGEAQLEYLRYTQLDGGLRWELGAERRQSRAVGSAQLHLTSVPTARPSSAGPSRSKQAPVAIRRGAKSGRPERTLWPAFAVAAAVLLAGVAVAVYFAASNGSTGGPPKPSTAHVATVTDAQGVAWLSDELNPGDEIAPKTIEMESGDVEFVFTSGVQVNVTGAAELRIDNPMRVTMMRGGATFACPHDAKGFTVELPHGVRVVDLGTRFTIEQTAQGAKVRVLEGSVELHGVSETGNPTRRVLTQNLSATITTGRIAVQDHTGEPVATHIATSTGGATSKAGFPVTVAVGEPGNEADATGYGHVDFAYQIGKYEVTNEQYCQFLNAVAQSDPFYLYNEQMAAEYGGITRSGSDGSFVYTLKEGMAAKPINFVSWFDAVRYANWLSNGKGNGDTETGPYMIVDGNVTLPDHAALAAAKGVKWVLPTEDEWYKAAYYDPSKSEGPGYWRLATRSDDAPAANYNTNEITDGGKFPASASGTHDQNGNMWEWNELTTDRGRGLRGGSFYLHDKVAYMQSSTRYDYIAPGDEQPNYGFRIAAVGAADDR